MVVAHARHDGQCSCPLELQVAAAKSQTAQLTSSVGQLGRMTLVAAESPTAFVSPAATACSSVPVQLAFIVSLQQLQR